MRRKLSRPSPAMVVALIALFVALGGSGYAAVKFNPKVIKNNSVPGKKLKNNSLPGSKLVNNSLPGSKLRNNSVTGLKINESTLLTVPSATNAERFGGQLPGAFLEAGATAANSHRLAGLEPTSFVRRECSQNTGQNKGVVTIQASAGFSSTFTAVSGYSCSGQTIEARRLGPGRYEVLFNGVPSSQAIATSIVPGVSADMISIFGPASGLFTVNVLDPLPAPGAFVDHPFTLVVL
jgi:hypothetical protein